MDTKKSVISQRKNDTSRIGIEKRVSTGKGVVLGSLFTVAVAWLFYDSWIALVGGVVWIPVIVKRYKEQENRKKLLHNRCIFKEMLQLLSSFLQTGFSIENAFLETEREINMLFSKKEEMCQSLHQMNQKIQLSISVEQEFLVFAKKTKLEEAMEFADILFYAKRLGGNYIENIQKTTLRMEEKMELNQEIEAMLAEKKLELKVMVVMPILIITYIKLTSFEFITSLYHSPAGVLLMSLCLGWYLLMAGLGRRMVEIHV